MSVIDVWRAALCFWFGHEWRHLRGKPTRPNGELLYCRRCGEQSGPYWKLNTKF